MKSVVAVLAAGGVLAFAAAKEPPVSLHIETADGFLTPASAFELRFNEPMVGDAAVGKPASEAPLVIKPAIPGTWTWVSTQSGVFQPVEAPPLNTTFQITLRSDVRTAAGKAFRGNLKDSVETRPFRVNGWYAADYWSADDATAKPRIGLCFPAEVDAAAAAKQLWYTDDAKLRVEATAEYFDIRKTREVFPAYRSDDKSNLTWVEQFREFRESGGKQDRNTTEEEEEGGEETVQRGGPVFKNQLLVSPAKPLPPGKNWRLIVGQGLTSLDGIKLGTDYPVEIGTIVPFTVTKLAPENLVYSGKRVVIEFSKTLHKDALANPAKFVTVNPPVADLKVELPKNLYDERNQLIVTGAFELAKDYTVTVAGEIAAKEPFTLGQPFSQPVSFSPVPSRLYFQEFATHQQRAGTRTFHLMAINTRSVRVTAKVIPPDSATAALAAYAKYYKEDGTDSEEWLQKVDEKTVPGTAAWQKEFIVEAKVDEKKLVGLNWDEILGPGKTGVVLLTAEQTSSQAPNVKRVGAQALVQVTDLGLVWKDSGDYFFHAFSLNAATPAAGATLTMLDEAGAATTTLKFAADGTARMPKKKADAPEPVWAVLKSGADQLAVRFDGDREALQFGRFRINVWGEEEDIMLDEMEGGGKERGLMFTDRPVYRPGEGIHVKAIIRNYEPGQPHVPAGKAATFRVKGPRQQLITEQKVTLNEMGAFTADVQLPPEMVGYFRAVLLFNEAEDDEWGGVGTGFSVQEYQPNSFEVKVAVPKTPLIGSPIELPIAAKYYMGKTLSKAQVAWNARAADERFQPEGFEDYLFTNALYDWRLENKLSGSSSFSAQGRVDISEKGTAAVSFNVFGNTKLPQPRRIRFTTEITDLNQQTVAEREEFLAHSSDFYLGIRRMPEVVRAGDALPLQVIAVRNDGTPMPEPVQAEVKLTRIDWQTNRVEEADDADNFRSEPLMQLVASIPLYSTSSLVQKGSKFALAEPDKKDTSFKAEKPGLYLITAVARDAGGRDVITTATVYVYGKDQLAWNYRNRFQVELALDKPEYRPGEQATVLVKTPISGPALVTIERENVKRHFFTKLEGNAPAIRIPVEESDAPNVYVSVLVLRGAQDSTKKFKAPEYRVGYTQLKVTRPDAKLYVNVKPAKTQVQPREEVAILCEVRDVDGKPVQNAEVTLWAADEGILSLTGFETPDPLTYFSKLMRLEVTTGLTVDRLLGEDPDERVFENKGYLVGGMGKGGDAAVRRNFLGTAYWNAALRTDAEGKVNVKFAAPDGLTRYRVMAVAQTKRDQFGHSEAPFEINKPLMLEPAPPRFANVGDQMLVRAVLHNTTAQTGEAVVKVQLDGTATSAETEKKINLGPNSSVALDFAMDFVEPGEARWTWRADFAAGGTLLQDSVESKFKVVYPTPLLREIRHARIDGAETDLLAGVDPALLSGKGVVRVSFSNSRMFELREGVSELLHYPYGCVEQTTSALMPWVALRDFRSVLPELNRSEEEFKGAIDRGVARILSMQTGTGGLAYWPGGAEPDFWPSAYGAVGLASARKSGANVPDYDLTRLSEYLSKQLRGAADSNEKWELSSRAFACYALALLGQPEAAYHEVLFKKRAVLTQETRAFLALAILESNGPAAMADTLLKMRDKAVEPDMWFGNLARAQGVRLLAWSRLAPKSDGTMAIANALFDLRKGGHWSTTQGNVWAVIGLAEYIRKTEADRKEVKGSLMAGDEKAGFQLAAKGGVFEKEFPLAGGSTLKLANPAKGRLFTQVKVEARPKTLVTERADRGYAISRRYQKINDDGSLSDLGEPQVGDRVLVTIRFNAPTRATYVAIDDPLPAVFEGVNPEFKTQQMNVDLATVWQSDFTEIREDRALFFRNTLPEGNHEIRYLARVRAAGVATAPPTKIEEMYQPERFGLSASQVIKGTVAR